MEDDHAMPPEKDGDCGIATVKEEMSSWMRDRSTETKFAMRSEECYISGSEVQEYECIVCAGSKKK